ncbi:MAG: SOS response-associated peptidase [Betaproteobacteria bacterium]|nr:SOS response-associated peptidase [Betaproteobacteria bacterium]
MCGRYELHSHPQVIALLVGLGTVPELLPRYNIAPTQVGLIVRAGEPGGREAVLAHWGLIPFWAKERDLATRMINARAETLAEKPAFRQALKKRRCLVPADGFYEWQGAPGNKQPWHIGMADDAPFAMAGLWERWRDPEGALLDSYTIITTAANEMVKRLHDRMPAILPPANFAAWLDPANDAAGSLLTPFPAEEMRAYPVSPRVNKVKNDDAACVTPVDDAADAG